MYAVAIGSKYTTSASAVDVRVQTEKAAYPSARQAG